MSKATEQLEQLLARLVNEPSGATVHYPSTEREIDPEILGRQMVWLAGHPRVRQYQPKFVGMDIVPTYAYLKVKAFANALLECSARI